MADQTNEEITITIKSSGDKKYSLTVLPSLTIAELKEKISHEADVPTDRQRLIYSGRVLKDADTVASYKIQSGHTIHLVKSAGTGSGSGAGSGAGTSSSLSGTNTGSRTAGAQSSGNTDSSTSAPSNIAAGTGAFNPLAGLTGARYAGYNVPMPSASMFGADGGMDSLPDENQLSEMLESPGMQAAMQQMLSDPQMLDFLIQQSPQLRSMGPMAREMLQSDYMRQMLTNPQMMRQMMQMNRTLGGLGGGLGGSGGSTTPFPAPGPTGANANTDSNSNESREGSANNTNSPLAGQASSASASSAAAAANPFAALFPNGTPSAQANPFASLLAGGNFGAGGAGSGAGSVDGYALRKWSWRGRLSSC
ncbi:hypothetical protein PACTADRAFT_86383 [Pachysolen tannophilus NRRL Y-2460]|uniref:Ubiquitin-like domain-containing protein n=1 Tax=Pachysolen tannophilus NRRL Y-2460 TaxID=669874 RepID=A0A1E4TR08_PACTA|nr:hypothetical protein PACTADRAFT_86383 [Pachysolen tannophilus NRRL Y-2460]